MAIEKRKEVRARLDTDTIEEARERYRKEEALVPLLWNGRKKGKADSWGLGIGRVRFVNLFA